MRRGVVTFLVGLALGLATALAWPDLVYERRSVSLWGADRVTWPDIVAATTQDGWRIVRVDQDAVYQLERPRLRLPVSDIRRSPQAPTAAPKPAGR